MKITRIIIGEIETNCYILQSENEIAVVDPGADSAKIISVLKKTPGKVKYIINTHHHYDHTDENGVLQKFAGAPILIHEYESPFINFPVDKYLADNEEIIIGKEKIKIINTPGHTPGSICLMGENFILTGDLIFYNGYGRTDLEGGDSQQMKKSLEKIQKLFTPGMIVYPGHDEIFQIKK